jgi:SAM-dependent methyltransferase
MSDEVSTYDRFMDRYEAGGVPWDDPSPPPEIIELAAELPPGHALDLGCGFGRVAIYLAGLGWSADGIDFIPKAIEVARQRAAAAGLTRQAHFHVASAAELSFLSPPYDLAVDIGCMHSFTEEMLPAYRNEVARLLRDGALYVLFAHLRDELVQMDDRPRGIPEEVIMALMESTFQLERVAYGMTQVADQPPWRSAWFWFRRKAHVTMAANSSS